MGAPNIKVPWNPVRVLAPPGGLADAINCPNTPTVLVTGRRLCQHALGSAAHVSAHLTVASARWQSVHALAGDLRNHQPRCVIAVGGGSAMDATKVACALAGLPQATSPQDLDDIVSGAIPLRRKMELWLIPTTAGTGSEVTKWSSIWTDDGRKVSVEAPALYPDVALIDPTLTYSMNPRLTAATGLDAAAHAVESIWSKNHQPATDRHAGYALTLIAQHLPAAVSAPAHEHRAAMSVAALHAGLALSWCRSTAAHALSYPLTGILGVEHGLAVSLMLLAMLPPTERIAPDRVAFAAQQLGVADAEGIAAFIRDIFRRAGLGTRLSDFGVTDDFLNVIADTAINQPRYTNHPDGLTTYEIHQALARHL